MRALAALAALLLPAWGACAPPPTAPEQGSDTVLLLHTNDVHAHMLPDDKGRGGWAAIATLIRREKQGRRDVLVVDAGDMTQGTPVSTIFHGTPIFQVMNAVGYDLAALGNHEFDNGTAYTREFRSIADFPLLSANALEHGELVADAPTALFDVDGVRVGIIGLTTSDAVFQPGVSFLLPEDVVRKYVPELDAQADVIVALSHLGVERDRALAAATEGIDVIVGGHSHTVLERPERVGDTWIVQAGSYGRHLGRLELVVDLATEDVLSVDARLIAVPGDAAPDPATAAVIDAWESRVRDEMDVRIGRNPREQSIPELAEHIERIWRDAYRADFAYQNPGGTRDYLPAGDILVRHIWNAMPFDNTLVVLELEPQQVRALIPKAEFAQPRELYSLVTNSYVAARLKGTFRLGPERWHAIETSWRQPIVDYVRLHGHLSPD